MIEKGAGFSKRRKNEFCGGILIWYVIFFFALMFPLGHTRLSPLSPTRHLPTPAFLPVPVPARLHLPVRIRLHLARLARPGLKRVWAFPNFFFLLCAYVCFLCCSHFTFPLAYPRFCPPSPAASWRRRVPL